MAEPSRNSGATRDSGNRSLQSPARASPRRVGLELGDNRSQTDIRAGREFAACQLGTPVLTLRTAASHTAPRTGRTHLFACTMKQVAPPGCCLYLGIFANLSAHPSVCGSGSQISPARLGQKTCSDRGEDAQAAGAWRSATHKAQLVQSPEAAACATTRMAGAPRLGMRWGWPPVPTRRRLD